MNLIHKIKEIWRTSIILNELINNRVDIENTLIQMAQGKLPHPSKRDLEVLALRLGTPKKHWPKAIKNHEWEGQPLVIQTTGQIDTLH